MDEFLEQAEQMVALIRSQNWKNGGVLSVDHPDAVALINQALRAAASGARERGMTDGVEPYNYERAVKLQAAEIRRLRAALSDARDALHNDFEPDNQSKAWHRANAALEAMFVSEGVDDSLHSHHRE